MWGKLIPLFNVEIEGAKHYYIDYIDSVFCLACCKFVKGCFSTFPHMEKFESINAHTVMLAVCLLDPQKLSTLPFRVTLMGLSASRHKYISKNETKYNSVGSFSCCFHCALT